MTNAGFQRDYYDAHYGARAAILDEQLQQPLFADFQSRLAHRVLDHAPPRRPLRVDEQACGEGLFTAALVAAADDRGIDITYTGGDISAAAVALAQKAVGRGSFSVGDATENVRAHEPSSIDLLLVKNLLHHLPDPVPFLQAVRDALDPDGVFVASEAPRGSFQAWVFSIFAPRRERYWFGRSPAVIRRHFAEAGLEVVAVDDYSFLPYELAFAIRFSTPRRLLRPSPAGVRRIARLDDALTTRMPALASYRIWVARLA